MQSKPIFISLLILLFTFVFIYIFNPKIDLNGDNCGYYILSTSIVSGNGFSNIEAPVIEPSATFPPGYPLLMSILRLFTPSVIAQKVLNGMFLLGFVLLLFLFIRKFKLPDSMAFVACVPILLNIFILHFSTMMMSEMSYMFFTILALWCLYKVDYEKVCWKDTWFYLLIFATAYNYHIRTQGITLAVAIICFFLISKRWKHAVVFLSGYVVCLLPWMIRNSIVGVGQSRYLDQIFAVNSHRPETGLLDIGGVITRWFETFQMLIVKAIPNSIMPYPYVSYQGETSFPEWIYAILLLTVIVIGLSRFGKFKYFFFLYIFANLGIISLFNDPGGNRYLTTVIPFLEMGLFIGLYTIISFIFKKAKAPFSFSPLWLLLLLIIFSPEPVQSLHTKNKSPFPDKYMNFFLIATEVREKFPPGTVVCSRKPGLFYMYSKSPVCSYKWTEDEKELISDMLASHVDYVVLDQLGFSSTQRYLFPVVQKHPDIFVPVFFLPDPETYLIKFQKEEAIKFVTGKTD